MHQLRHVRINKEAIQYNGLTVMGPSPRSYNNNNNFYFLCTAKERRAVVVHTVPRSAVTFSLYSSTV